MRFMDFTGCILNLRVLARVEMCKEPLITTELALAIRFQVSKEDLFRNGEIGIFNVIKAANNADITH